MTAPYPPVLNYGTEEAPLFAGQTGAVGYARALFDVRKALDELETKDAPSYIESAGYTRSQRLVEEMYRKQVPL